MFHHSFDQQRFLGASRTKWLGRNCLYLFETASTNEVAKGNSKNGMVIVADYQTAGRGRQGQGWQAPPCASLLFSLLIRPNWGLDRRQWPMMLMGVAVVEALREIGWDEPVLKWPNDLIVMREGKWFKLGGMMAEATIEGDRITQVIIGVGLNANWTDSELAELNRSKGLGLPALALNQLENRPIDREQLLATICERLEKGWDSAERGLSPHAKWQNYLGILGQKVMLTHDVKRIEGIAKATQVDGALIIEDEFGRRHIIAIGELSLRESLTRNS